MDLLPHSTRCLDLRFYSDFCLAESVGTGQKSTSCNLLLLFRGRSSTTAGGWVVFGCKTTWNSWDSLHSCILLESKSMNFPRKNPYFFFAASFCFIGPGWWIPRPSGVFSGSCWESHERGFFLGKGWGWWKKRRMTPKKALLRACQFEARILIKKAGYLQSDRRSASKKAHEMHQ